MHTQNTYLVIEGLLNEAQLQQIQQIAKQGVYEDGKNTASDAAREVKQNLQLTMQSEAYMGIQQVILGAMNQNQLFRNALLPKNVYPFLISKYSAGMTYGWHVDSPVMGNMMRTDIAMTLFLNEPSAYEGGELELQTPAGNVLYKLNKGDAICYPCTQLHRVRPVTAGERQVAVTWIQSLVKPTEQRAILFDIQTTINKLRSEPAFTDSANLLQQNYSNLLRMWAE